MILYHRTSREAAQAIAQTGRFESMEYDGSVYFSTHRQGQAVGYGEAVVVVDVPEELCMLDDEFPGDEEHYRILNRDITPEYIVRIEVDQTGKD